MREELLKGSTRRIQTGCGHLYITVNRNEQDVPIEVFVRLGKAGGCASSQTEALGRLITVALRAGVKVGDITHQLKGIGCHQPAGFGFKKVLSCSDAVAICLQNEVKYETKESTREEIRLTECELSSREATEEK